MLDSVTAGGVIFRGILEAYPTNNITFIALASPLAGQYGGKKPQYEHRELHVI